ncbi:MAG TPA: hypothetical protein VHD76_20100 [Bryobacteraceae bacterium]|jgi:uncharacterized protein (TIGR03437 family)|nr:hypothetical protein [Bryobacteraceae bacterium]
MKCIAALFLSSAIAFGQAQFVSGQAARAEIGQPNFSAQNLADPSQNPPGVPSARLLGSPGGVAYANGSLFVVDSNRVQAFPVQNRVLIYENISSQIPAANQQITGTSVRCPVCQAAANVVVGQPDFMSTDPGVTASTLNVPNHVASDGKVLVISDTNNNRVLIYNSIPGVNGASANVVLGQSDFNTGKGTPTPSASSLLGPEGVWVQDGRLFVADTNNNRVLIWNKIPTSNNQPADIVLGQPNFTARSPVLNPPVNAQTMSAPVSVTSDGTHVFVTDLGNNRVLIWNSIPTSNGQAADVEIGQPDFSSSDPNHVANICPSTTASDGTVTYPYECAATLNYPRFALSDGQRLFIADGGNDRVIVFESIPTTNGARGKYVLGQPNEYENIIANGTSGSTGGPVYTQGSASSMITPTALAWDGSNLYVADPFNRRVLVFSPGQNLVPDTGIVNAASQEVFALGNVAITSTTSPATITENDKITVTINGTDYSYTVLKTDTLATIVTGISNAILNSNNGAGDPNVSPLADTVSLQLILVAKQGGPNGDKVTLAATTTTTASSGVPTITATASGANLTGGQDASQVAPGTLISVFAKGGLTDQGPAAAVGGKTLPRQLAGVELYVDGVRAPLLYVSDSQINAQIPFEVSDARGVTTWVRSVRKDGSVVVSAAVGVPIVSANPGIFAMGGSEPRQVVALHATSYATAVVSVDGSAHAGDVAVITIDGHDYSYTVAANDTLTSIQNALMRLINANKSEKVTAMAAGAFNRIILTAKVPGKAGEGISLAQKVTGTSTQLILSLLARSTSTTSGSTTTTTYATCCSNTAYSLVTNDNPAQPDEIINIYATGLGQVTDAGGSPQGVTGEPYTGPATNVQQFVDALVNGNSTANVLFTGLAEGMVGTYVVQLQLGDNLTTNKSSQLRIAQGLNTSNIVTIPVVAP